MYRVYRLNNHIGVFWVYCRRILLKHQLASLMNQFILCLHLSNMHPYTSILYLQLLNPHLYPWILCLSTAD